MLLALFRPPFYLLPPFYPSIKKMTFLKLSFPTTKGYLSPLPCHHPLLNLVTSVLHEWRGIIRYTASGETSYKECVPFIFIKATVITGYFWGTHFDNKVTERNVSITTKKGIFNVHAENDWKSEERMGNFWTSLDLTQLSHTNGRRFVPTSGLHKAGVVPLLLSKPSDTNQLHLLLTALSNQSSPPHDIVLVDDGSKIFPGLKAYENVHVVQLKKNRGPAVARNAGIWRALQLVGGAARDGCVCIFLTDLDCLPTSSWIANGMQSLRAERPHLFQFSHGRADEEPVILAGTTLSVQGGQTNYFARYHHYFGTLNPRIF